MQHESHARDPTNVPSIPLVTIKDPGYEREPWHRPFTTLELLALQGFPVKFADGSWVDLDGGNKRAKRARIGNAVPPPAAAAIGRSCLETLEHARSGAFFMSAAAVWVAPKDAPGKPSAAWAQ